MKKLINLVIGISFIGLLIWNPYPFKLLELKEPCYLISFKDNDSESFTNEVKDF